MRLGVPPGDTLPRVLCDACNRVFYENPKLVVGCLPLNEGGRVLLCRRAIEPRKGLWTLPSGFLENGETLEEGAIRETLEEAGARVSVARLFAGFSLPDIHQVYLLFLARLESPEFHPGHESSEARLFDPGEIPWNDLAFRAIRFCLERYVASGAGVKGPVHLGTHRGVSF